MNLLNHATVARLGAFAAMLTVALPALADGDAAGALDGIISPGFGTLGAIVGWMRLLLL